MTQEELDGIAAQVGTYITQYQAGMITIIEFINAVSFVFIPADLREDELCGLIDANTGMRYPTWEEMQELVAAFDSGN